MTEMRTADVMARHRVRSIPPLSQPEPRPEPKPFCAARAASVATLACALIFEGSGASAQSVCDPAANRFCGEAASIAARSDVQRAMSWIDADNPRARQDLITLTEIPAPPFGEQARGEAFGRMLRDAGADSVWTDSVGNVLGLRRGTGGDETLVLSGHLDTVFPEGTDVTVRVRGDTLFAPGTGDDTRGLIVVLTVLRALEEAGIETRDDVLFVGTVGEEGLGDLRGVKHLFREGGPGIDAFITVDGGGEGSITNGALGSRRYRVTYEGPGGHSWGAFGGASPIHALGRAITLFDDAAARFTASGARTSYNVGRIGGGTSVNSIAFEAWMEVDMRSEDRGRLMAIDTIFRDAVHRALREENANRRSGDALTVNLELVGDRPSGIADESLPFIRRVAAATAHFGDPPDMRTSSTDANIPISMGIPAVSIGRGGISGNSHAPEEYWVDRDATKAVKRALLVVLLESGLAGAAM
jgi:acetylornithine deacetylase/succinyl-diaminopimelate desuccinylase-like protein